MKEIDQNFHKAIEESFNFINTYQLNIFGPDRDGTLWQPIYNQINGVGVTDSILYYYQTPYFNLVQRTQSKWLYLNNAYAQSGINNLVNMILGNGFQYKYPDQDLLDKWMIRNKFASRMRECAQKFFVEGESFYRLFDSEDEYRDVRFVMPQYVYDEKYNGICTEEEDYEKVKYYTIATTPPERVSPEDMQHRKNAWSEEKRGISILYSIGPALLEATGLLQSLVQTAKALSKIAWVRYHNASKQSAELFQGDVQATQDAQFNGLANARANSRENIEYYAPGSVLDTSDQTKIEFPGQYINGDAYISVLRGVLRLCAARFGLPENVLSQDADSMPAYNASLANYAHCTKGLKVWQERFAEWDMDLFEMAGFDRSKIKVEFPEIAIHDKDQTVREATFLLNQQLASRSTVSTMFGLNFDEEQEQIKSEPEFTPKDQQGQDQQAPQDQGSPKENGTDQIDTTGEQ